MTGSYQKTGKIYYHLWISQFTSQIWYIIWNKHEAITQIPKTIQHKANSTDGLDSIIDIIIQQTEHRSDIFTSIINI